MDGLSTSSGLRGASQLPCQIDGSININVWQGMPNDQIDLNKVLDEGDASSQKREAQAIARSQKTRKACDFIPESALKSRKAFFCNETDGFLTRKVPNNQMNMSNPAMMDTMLKQNLQSVVHMVTF